MAAETKRRTTSDAAAGGRVLVLLDGSEGARQELSHAIAAALERNALLDIAGVAWGERSFLVLAAFAAGYRVELAQRESVRERELEVREVLDLVPRQLSVRTWVLSGPPREILGRLRSEHHYDLCFPAEWAN